MRKPAPEALTRQMLARLESRVITPLTPCMGFGATDIDFYALTARAEFDQRNIEIRVGDEN